MYPEHTTNEKLPCFVIPQVEVASVWTRNKQRWCSEEIEYNGEFEFRYDIAPPFVPAHKLKIITDLVHFQPHHWYLAKTNSTRFRDRLGVYLLTPH